MRPTVVEVIALANLPFGETGSWRAAACWSDGTAGEAIRFHAHAVLFGEADLIAETREQIGSLQFRRDNDSSQC